MFSPQKNRTRVCSEAHRDYLNQVSVCRFGLLLLRTQVHVLLSHLHKRIAPKGETHSSSVWKVLLKKKSQRVNIHFTQCTIGNLKKNMMTCWQIDPIATSLFSGASLAMSCTGTLKERFLKLFVQTVISNHVFPVKNACFCETSKLPLTAVSNFSL